MQTTTTLSASDTCDFGWCATDHDLEPGLHYQAGIPVTDLNGRPVNVALFHDDRGRTGVHVGEHELGLCAALELAVALRQAIGLGVDLPGALAEVAR